MKNLFLFLLSHVAVLPLGAQKKSAQSVAKVVESLRRAIISANADSLDMLVADELSYGQLRWHDRKQKGIYRKNCQWQIRFSKISDI